MLARRLWQKLGSRSAIAGILGAAFVCAVALLLLQVRSRQLDLGVAAELLLVVVLSVEGIVAVQHLRHSRVESVHQVLVSVMKDYRSAEMFRAINALWRSRREHGEGFVDAYIEEWRADDERIAKLPPEARLAALEATLHYQRRLVKEFYTMLAGLYEIGVLPRELLYTYWNETELRIVPEIVIPLESAVTRELKERSDLGAWYGRLMRLYDDRPEAERNRAGVVKARSGRELAAAGETAGSTIGRERTSRRSSGG